MGVADQQALVLDQVGSKDSDRQGCEEGPRLWPSFADGAKVLGVKCKDLKRCRTSTAGLLGKGKGSTTLTLAVRALERTAESTKHPVHLWAVRA